MSALLVAAGKCGLAMLAAAAAIEIRIVYDNQALDRTFQPDRGFAAVVQVGGSRIVFDTGADGELLLRNLAAGIHHSRCHLAPAPGPSQRPGRPGAQEPLDASPFS